MYSYNFTAGYQFISCSLLGNNVKSSVTTLADICANMCGRGPCGVKGGCGLMDRKFAHPWCRRIMVLQTIQQYRWESADSATPGLAGELRHFTVDILQRVAPHSATSGMFYVFFLHRLQKAS